MFVPDQS
jgi:hypothetical protein